MLCEFISATWHPVRLKSSAFFSQKRSFTDHPTFVMATMVTILAHLGALARPALRMGGEWAGWSCGFDPYSGALRSGSEFQAVTTERWSGNSLKRRSVQVTPDDDEGARCVNRAEGDAWSTLPVAVSGTTSLMPGARAGLFGAVQLDMLNADAWALDEAISEASWRCESIFDGLGGERQRKQRGDRMVAECPEQRTRVICSFNPNTGEIAAVEPVVIWQERCWSVQPSEELDGRGGGRSSGVDAAWVAAVVGQPCFGGQKRIPYGQKMFARSHLSLPGGVELRGRPGLLEICVTADPGQPSECKTVLRRSWLGGSRYASVETIGDTQPVDPSVLEPAGDEISDDDWDLGMMDV